ncbi:PilZ domain-containing protein [Eubacteriales bacterium OttesenSCG-928-N14]|nr:PilZ domain-containing protein [Eubacteriales bacterium OttesenSCG-928-N14]
MLVKDFLNIGEAMDLQVGEDSYRTKLQDVFDDETFVVLQPTRRGLPIYMYVGQTVKCICYREDGIYEFEAEVRYLSPTTDDVRICTLLAISELTKLQRRAFYRLDGLLDVPLRLHITWEDGSVEEFEAEIMDLSATGMKFRCYKKLKPEMELSVEMELQKNDAIMLSAQVVRTENGTDNREPSVIAIQFINHSSKAQNYISQFILKKQIQRRKVGR